MRLFKNPIYLTLAITSLLYVAYANHRGWSLLQTIASRSWQQSGPSTQHK